MTNRALNWLLHLANEKVGREKQWILANYSPLTYKLLFIKIGYILPVQT